MGPWPGFGRRVSLAAGGERNRNPAGRIRIRPLPGVGILGLENPGGREALGLTRKRLEDPNRPVPGWGQPAGGGGVSVWSYFSRRTWIDRWVTSSHLAMRYMVTPAARAVASWAVTVAEASAWARPAVW